MKQKHTTFYCFSPPVMVATFLLETTMLVYVLWRYRMSALTRLATMMLGSLALFQLAEYNVCGGMGLHAETWSRMGYVAIALLPALGLHTTHVMSGKKIGRGVAFAYATTGFWITLFAFGERAFNGYVCGGNYVIFQLKEPMGGLFFVWYYAVLLATIWLAMRLAKNAKLQVRRALQAQVIGYSVFMIPTSIINLISPATRSGVPSIMCGFAVLFAIAVVFGIMPLEKSRVAEHAAPKR